MAGDVLQRLSYYCRHLHELIGANQFEFEVEVEIVVDGIAAVAAAPVFVSEQLDLRTIQLVGPMVLMLPSRQLQRRPPHSQLYYLLLQSSCDQNDLKIADDISACLDLYRVLWR